MSYILEALKKAQAERQLGDAPTIHAPQAAQAAPARATARKPLLLGLCAGALVVAAGALLFWRAGSAPAPASAPAATPAPAAAVAPAAPAAPIAKTPPAASPTLDVSAPPAPPAAPSAAPSAPPPAAPTAPPPAAPVAAPAATATARTPATAAPVSPAPSPAAAQPAPRAAVPTAAPEDSLPFLQQLPEPLRSEVPRPAFGGYMYSANPADRLLIVDKVLRREGEEVAPGLVLEKLLPKTAVMNYRGTRYRVPY
ncbi:general secretion pathway protein GspB [Massilia sp. TN1-12]|uniref:general secretion pathway protein GspB n=1 Tax=Massilia paldalensis TaxID=3377675 RepID=UPI00385151D5